MIVGTPLKRAQSLFRLAGSSVALAVQQTGFPRLAALHGGLLQAQRAVFELLACELESVAEEATLQLGKRLSVLKNQLLLAGATNHENAILRDLLREEETWLNQLLMCVESADVLEVLPQHSSPGLIASSANTTLHWAHIDPTRLSSLIQQAINYLYQVDSEQSEF